MEQLLYSYNTIPGVPNVELVILLIGYCTPYNTIPAVPNVQLVIILDSYFTHITLYLLYLIYS